MSQKGKEKEKPIASLIAGATAGGFEAFVTYPLESLKTQLQFAADGKVGLGKVRNCSHQVTPWGLLKETVQKRGIKGLYAGVPAVVIGNAAKAGVRFTTYDQFKSALKDENGHLSAPRSMLAGLGAGMMEAIIAVTPSETIKTKMIEDSKRDVPRYNGMVDGVRKIVAEEGLGGLYRGVGPVMLRQGANSAVRFSSYSTIKQLAQGSLPPGSVLPGWMTFGIGSCAGIITVYTTMPFE
jgi:solute carrier family 25 citrate transporter 1